jgi:hypothetical protein
MPYRDLNPSAPKAPLTNPCRSSAKRAQPTAPLLLASDCCVGCGRGLIGNDVASRHSDLLPSAVTKLGNAVSDIAVQYNSSKSSERGEHESQTEKPPISNANANAITIADAMTTNSIALPSDVKRHRLPPSQWIATSLCGSVDRSRQNKNSAAENREHLAHRACLYSKNTHYLEAVYTDCNANSTLGDRAPRDFHRLVGLRMRPYAQPVVRSGYGWSPPRITRAIVG